MPKFNARSGEITGIVIRGGRREENVLDVPILAWLDLVYLTIYVR